MPELLPANTTVWELFQSCATQWRYGMNGRVGLDYTAVYLVATSLRIKISKPMLQKIQLLEIWALQGQGEQG